MMWGIRMTAVVSMLHNNPSEGIVYRINIPKDRKYINVICIGMECVDNTIKGCYHSLNDLPDWIQGRIAILMLCDPDPPPTDIKGIGRRLSEFTFWVYG